MNWINKCSVLYLRFTLCKRYQFLNQVHDEWFMNVCMWIAETEHFIRWNVLYQSGNPAHHWHAQIIAVPIHSIANYLFDHHFLPHVVNILDEFSKYNALVVRIRDKLGVWILDFVSSKLHWHQFFIVYCKLLIWVGAVRFSMSYTQTAFLPMHGSTCT